MRNREPVRKRLLDAVDQIVFVEGEVTAPVDKLIAHAGASPTSLYAQFGSKDGLIAAALERRLEEWLESWQQAFDKAENDVERLLSVFEGLRLYQSEKLCERWCAFSSVASSHPRPSPAISSMLERESDVLFDHLVEYALPIAGEHAVELAKAIMMIYNGVVTMSLRKPYEHAIDDGELVARQMVHYWMAVEAPDLG